MKSIILLSICLLMGSASALDVTLLSNSIDSALAGSYLESLEAAGVDVTRVSAQDIEGHRSDPVIFILGGHRAPEGVGSIVDSILPDEEKEAILSSTDSRHVFSYPGLWSRGQRVIVFAGFEKEQTRQVLGETRTGVIDFLESNLSTLSRSYPPIDIESDYTELDAYQASALLDSVDAMVLDVRSPSYFEAGHLPGAVNLPVDELSARYIELDQNRTYLIYCGGNSQSMRAGDFLAGQGFTMLYRLVDGYAAWRDAGYPREV